MADIVVDTYKLNQYAQRISDVNRRIDRLDRRLDNLYTSVGLQDLWNLMQTDALTGFSWKLLRCQSYLQQTATDFEKLEKTLSEEDPASFDKNPISDIKDFVYDVGVAIKKGAEKVKSVAEKAVTDVLTSYYSHGTVYKAVQYGKAALCAVKGVAKIAGGVASVLGSGGMSTPVAILSVISGGNDVYNAIMDAVYTSTENYDKVGQNALKDTLADGGKILGSALGNEKVGEFVGTATYYGIDLVTSLESLHLSMDKIKQLSSPDMGKMAGELKEIAKIDVSKIFTTDLETLRYQTKLASYTFKETTKFVSTVSSLINVGDKAVDVGKGINDILTINNPDFENPVLNTIDTMSAVTDFTKGAYTLSTWDLDEMASKAKQVDSIFVFKENKNFMHSSIFFSKEFSDFTSYVESGSEAIKTTVTSGVELFK